MRQRLALNRIASLMPVCLFLFADILSPAPQPGVNPPTPAGRLVAEHPSSGGIGSWWIFHPDGSHDPHYRRHGLQHLHPFRR